MNRTRQLAARRALLVAESTLQRATLEVQCRELGLGSSWMGTGEQLLSRLKHLPVWVPVLAAAAVMIIPGRTATLARSALSLWQVWRTLRRDAPGQDA